MEINNNYIQQIIRRWRLVNQEIGPMHEAFIKVFSKCYHPSLDNSRQHFPLTYTFLFFDLLQNRYFFGRELIQILLSYEIIHTVTIDSVLKLSYHITTPQF